jgi:flagellar biosynthesis protein FlhG
MVWGNKKVIAVGGGKGGIGKSSFSANLGVVLSQQGKRVLLVDADLGAANLHTLTGVRYPDKTLDDFIHGHSGSLEQTLLDTPYLNLRLLSSASDILSIAAPNYQERQKLLRAIQKLDVDVIIFDLCAGTHTRAIDFFAIAPIGVIIVEPTPTSLENAFSFLKNLLHRHLLRVFFHDAEIKKFIQASSAPHGNSALLQFSDLLDKLETMEPVKTKKFREQFDTSSGNQIYLIANLIKTPQQFDVADRFVRIVKRYLSLDMKVLGALPFELCMDEAIVSRIPFVIKFPHNGYSKGLRHIAQNMALWPQA